MPTYRDAGVDLEAAERSVSRMSPAVQRTWNADVVGEFGGFAAGIAIPAGLADPIAMLSSDGVGTKAEVARRAGLLDGLGFDLVAMCADDLAAAGAKPIAMTDYLAVGRLDTELVTRLVESVAAACEASGIALLGGETAEHPGVMEDGQFDLAGTALGVLQRGTEIDGSEIRPGDRIIGVESPNLRSNGFSLIRASILKRFELTDHVPGTSQTVAEALLSPSVVYTSAIVGLVSRVRPHGLAHVTGGGLPGNIKRILPTGMSARIFPETWQMPPVFQWISAMKQVAKPELFNVFNMGIGFIVISSSDDAIAIRSDLEASNHRNWDIGEVTTGDDGVAIVGVG